MTTRHPESETSDGSLLFIAMEEVVRLRAELERVREAGRAVVEEWANAETFHEVVFEKLVAALRTALEGEGGKPPPQEGGE